jgi:hypothetical protein
VPVRPAPIHPKLSSAEALSGVEGAVEGSVVFSVPVAVLGCPILDAVKGGIPLLKNPSSIAGLRGEAALALFRPSKHGLLGTPACYARSFPGLAPQFTHAAIHPQIVIPSAVEGSVVSSLSRSRSLGAPSLT